VPHAHAGHQGFRFDPRSEGFLTLAEPYRRALARAERIWCLLAQGKRAEASGPHGKGLRLTPGRVRALEVELVALEAVLDDMRGAILAHVRRAARDPMREKVKNVVGAWGAG
jgi:hypothetical protein